MKRTMFLVVLMLSIAMAAPAAAAIKITKIRFNPPGPDTGTNEHLRKELVVIKNTGSRTVRLDGWRIVDAGRDHVYVFGDPNRGNDVFTDIRLRPGGYVRIHSGRGQDLATASAHGDTPTYYDFYWDLDDYVWNNGGDRARLIRPNRNVVDSCAYAASADSPHTCT
ncbi:MAG: lamin tail domain-containing protein [Actinomycetota bacterium]|nr:lamin tail domain-containing protein [Actinomycetota bacterium]